MLLAFTALPIGSPATRAGLGVGTFVAVFAPAYALRDVIKEAARGWITGRLMRLYGQRVVTLKLPRASTARARAARDARDLRRRRASRSPPTIRATFRHRPAASVVRCTFACARRCIRRRRCERAHIGSIKHIFRYDLTPIFSRLDNAVKQVPVLDAGRRVRFADAPREYRFPARIAFRPSTARASSRRPTWSCPSAASSASSRAV